MYNIHCIYIYIYIPLFDVYILVILKMTSINLQFGSFKANSFFLLVISDSISKVIFKSLFLKLLDA